MAKTVQRVMLFCLLVSMFAPAAHGGFLDGYIRGREMARQRQMEEEQMRQRQELLNQQQEALRLYEQQIRQEMERTQLLREAQRRDALETARKRLEALMNDPKWRRWASNSVEAELLRRLNDVYSELGLPQLPSLPPIPAGFTPGSVERIVSECKDAVVYVSYVPSGKENGSCGTGFVISPDGLVITCAHVIAPPTNGTKTHITGGGTVSVRAGSGGSYKAIVLFSDAANDYALLYLNGATLPYLQFSSFDAATGEDILVLGYPLGDSLGRELTVTRGIVSSIRAGGTVLQLDAATNPGNSGGPVLNSFGEVVGVAFAKIKDCEGLNFAVAAKAIPSIDDMIERSPIWAEALASAISKGDTKQVSDLLDEHTRLVSGPLDEDGWKAVHLAAAFAQPTVIDSLLSRGADVNAASNDGTTALMLAARGGSAETVSNLLAKGAQVNAVTKDGRTALYTALTSGKVGESLSPSRLEMAKMLVDHGANTVGASPDTNPLLVAAQHPEALDVALELAGKASNVDAQDSLGQTALIIASGNPKMNQLATALIAKGADVNAHCNDGFTPLHRAAAANNLTILPNLFAKGAKLEARTNYGTNGVLKPLAKDPLLADGCTPLMSAASGGHSGAVLALLRQGAKVNATNNAGLTALHLAAANGHIETVKLLVARGAKLRFPAASKSPSAASIAKKYGHSEVATLLARAAQSRK